MKQNIKYGLFEYYTENIGDEVQSIAASKFLPKIDYYFDRDNIDATETKPDDTVKIIMNGWYTHHPENWPPTNDSIKPLLISMHIEQDALDGEPAKAFASPKSIAYIKKHGGIGARNIPTKEFLEKHNIPTYFSGCITLTLNKDKTIKKEPYILAVDVPDEVFATMKQNTNRPILRLNTDRKKQLDRETKFLLAKMWLYFYQSAHAVVTTRLHTMLPCLALETPVLAISGRDPKRYEGLIDLVNSVTAEEYVNNPSVFPLETPPSNPSDYKKLRKSLEEKCKNYTGYMSQKSFMGDLSVKDLKNNPLLLQFFLDATHETWVQEMVSKELEIARAQNNHTQPGIKQSSRLLLKAIKNKLTR
jgi:hypothetical protein